MCFGVAASQGALLLAGGEKGMRYAMPNSRIMIHQPQSGCGVWLKFYYDLSSFFKEHDYDYMRGEGMVEYMFSFVLNCKSNLYCLLRVLIEAVPYASFVLLITKCFSNFKFKQTVCFLFSFEMVQYVNLLVGLPPSPTFEIDKL